MKAHTNEFKENIKTFGRELDSKITYTIDSVDYELSSEELNSVEPHYEADILKSVMRQLDIDSNVEIPLNTVINYQFGIKVGDEYEYLNFGNYVVYKIEKQEDTDSYKITCYDKMLYSMIEYEKMNITYPITIRSYINAICNKLGFTFKNVNDTFANYDREIQNELYLDSDENSLGYTFRDVLDELAQATASTICINEDDDELEIRYINNTNDTINEEYLKDVNVNFGEKYGPINSIVLSRASGSDNVYLQDEESVAQNGLCEIKITDNQIMNFNDRADYLPDILNVLDGLEYCINDFATFGVCYYNVCDRYNVQIGENLYSCVMFNDDINVTQGLEETIHTDMPKESETDYTKADKTDRRINQTYIMVDKQNGIIQDLASKVVVVSNTVSGNREIILENAYEGILHYLSIKGQISLLYPQNKSSLYGYGLVPSDELVPSNTLKPSCPVPYPNGINYPSDTLFPKDTILIVDDKEYKLDFNFLNYIDNNLCDEFVYEDGKCKIIRRVGINSQGQKYAFDNEIIEQRDDIDIQIKSDSVIRLKSFDNTILSATYLTNNDYTDVFATQVEMKSEIKQTAEEINLEVSKKVNEDEVVSTINQSAEQVTITGNRFVVESDNFKLTSDGTMTCKNGTFEGNVNTNEDLKVGNNIYVGQNQKSGLIDVKSINFTDKTKILKVPFSSFDALSVYSGVINLNNNQYDDHNMEMSVIHNSVDIDYVENTGTSSGSYGIAQIGKEYFKFDVYDNYYNGADTGIIGDNDSLSLSGTNKIYMNRQPTITSDARFKQKIKDINVNWIDDLKVKEFEYISGNNKKQIGLIAQDYVGKEYSKYFLEKNKQKNDEEYYSITYGNITNALIQYCQEIKKELKNQQEQIEQLKKEIEILKKGGN